MKKNDILLITGIFTIAIILSIFLIYRNNGGDEVLIRVNGIDYMSLPLSENNQLVIPGFEQGENLLIIENGKATIQEATCPDQLCVHQLSIQRNGEVIVCLPNLVSVEIISHKGADVDIVVK